MKYLCYVCLICNKSKTEDEISLIKLNFKTTPISLEKVSDHYCGIREICNSCIKGLAKIENNM